MQRNPFTNAARPITIPATLPAISSPAQSAPDDTHCDPPPAAPLAKSFDHRRAQSSRKDSFLDRSPVSSSPPNPARTPSRSSPTLLHLAAHPSKANSLPETAATRASDSAKTPKCPIARCACAPAIATLYAARPAASLRANSPAFQPQHPAMKRVPCRHQAISQAARAAPYHSPAKHRLLPATPCALQAWTQPLSCSPSFFLTVSSQHFKSLPCLGQRIPTPASGLGFCVADNNCLETACTSGQIMA